MKKVNPSIVRFDVIPLTEERNVNELDTEITYYMNKTAHRQQNNYYNKRQRNEETEIFYEKYMSYNDQDITPEQKLEAFLNKSSPVHNKILQLRQKELGYQRKFLNTLEKIISSTTASAEISNLGDIFRDLEEILMPLKKLHKRLFDKLLKNVNPGPVFNELKMDFWIYAPFIILLINALNLIEKFEKNALVKQELELIKSDMQKQINLGDSSFPASFDQLFYLPRQHLGNYGMHLSAIIKSAKKELSSDNSSKHVSDSHVLLIKIVQRCMKAKTAMDDVLDYVNFSVGENANKRIIRDLGSQLSQLKISPEDLASDFGSLVFEGKILHKWEKDKKYTNRYMVCMQKLILICHIHNGRGNKIMYTPIRELELHLYDPRLRFNVLETMDSTGDQSLSLTVVITDNNRSPLGDSFNLKCRTTSSYDILKKTLENLFKSSRISSKFHPRHTHDYEIHEVTGDFKKPRVCGLEKCSSILSGQFVVGVYCKTCKKYYHNHCFVTNSPETPYEDDIDLIRNLSRLDSDDDTDNEEDIDEKCLTNIFGDFESFKENINAYRIGSCILYSRDETNGIYKLAYRAPNKTDKPKILKIVISRDPTTKKFKGASILQDAKEFNTFTDVIRDLKNNCNFKFIHKSQTSYSKENSDGRNPQGSHSSRGDFPEDIRSFLCFGDRKLALRGTPSGTYLVYPEFKDPCRPFTILVSRGNTSTPGRIPIEVIFPEETPNQVRYIVKTFVNKHQFDSMSGLIEYYKNRCNLLYPLLQKEDEPSKEEQTSNSNDLISKSNYYYIDTSDEEEDEEDMSSSSSEDSDASCVGDTQHESSCSRRLCSRIQKDLEETDFYGGFIDKFEAQRIMLSIGVKGLYMLRVKPSTKELRISLVKQMDKKEISPTFRKLKIIHIKITVEEEDDDEGLKRLYYNMGQIQAFSFKELIETYQTQPHRNYDFKYPYSP
ncbi:uncharacterized protein [Lepeophtheirus salmonis]|uniref:uncharacterized protein n=1 Tax=Lepeophtheirus salmonis TaxID=72036 RepID=UPI001AEAC1CC|nr:uncharacterized protein LOC121114489 [Lepeophtheirus salmonis]